MGRQFGKRYHNKAWWRHQIETFSASLAFVWGINRSPVNSPHKGQWQGSLVFSLICAWTNGRVNNGYAGHLRRNRAHYDVTVMGLLLWYVARIEIKSSGTLLHKYIRLHALRCLWSGVISNHIKAYCHVYGVRSSRPRRRFSYQMALCHWKRLNH